MKVRFSSPAHESRYWWAIIECDERFLVCVRERLALPDGLLEQAKTHGLIDAKPLHVVEYRQENDKWPDSTRRA